MHICRKTGIFKLADVRISICNMAGNKINTKTKGKEDKGRVNKGVNLNSDDVEDLDFALLRKPVHTSVTGFAQARKIFDLATEELKDLLSNECDLLYECKVCRNIFRSLANLISHKRVYCKEKFNTSVHGHFIKSVSTLEEIIKIKRTEVGYQEALKNNNADTNVEEVDRIPLSKDLTAIVENIARTKGTDNNEETQVALQKIPSSSVAVFQNVNSLEDSKDNMRAQIKELDNILSREQAVLQSDGQFTVESTKQTDKDTDSVIQISDDEDNDGDSLKCKICDNQFSTQKTLRFHMKYKHLESRLVYPCPDCLEIFSTSWSVYRHLFKVHRKTAAQIRRLRESIQSKAFRMNNPPAFYEKRKNNMKAAVVQKITEEERLDQENQAWMDNMEGDGEVPRCGGCGRTFERRAALAAHTHTCQPRSRALQRRPDAKRIEIQIRKDYNKGPGAAAAGTLLKDASEKLTSEEAQPTPKSQTENEKADDADEKDQSPMDIEEDQKSNDSAESPEKPEVVPQLEVKLAAGLPFALQAEKSNLAAFKQRIQSDIEFLKLTCKKCDSTFTSLSLLYEHMADHFKWMRYACKLCNFKNYNFEKLPEHVKLVHKLKGDNDFYFSTVKAIDGTEAMILSRCLAEDSTDEANDANESPESRRASRCSSDSSRISDDSSSSSTFKETGTRKRKMRQNKYVPKRKKEEESKDAGGEDSKDGEISMDKVLKSIIGDDSTNVKSFEENSSDIDEIEDKVSKRNVTSTSTSVASRRPVRKRTKPKNEDFEYDLSNLLKMEAQGYRDSQTLANNKTTQVKKKQPETVSSPEINSLNLKDYYGALLTLSKKTADTGKGHMKNSFFPVVREIRTTSDLFVRPQIPRILYRGDKVSPKKDMSEDLKDSSPGKHSKPAEITNTKDLKSKAVEESTKTDKDEVATLKKIENVDTKTSDNASILTNNDDSQETSNMFTIEDVKTLANTDENNFLKEKESAKNVIASENSLNTAKNSLNPLKIPAVLPIKFRRQSLDLIKKNPIINKNITDFTKAGMKTKILVIKPIRSKDGSRTVTTPLKYQTIKLKDPNRGSTSEDNSEQVVVVKVPKVDRTMSRTVPEANDKPEQTTHIVNTSNKEITEKTNEENEVTRTAEDVRNDERACDEINNKCNDLNNISVASDMNKEKVSDSVKQLEADVTKPDVTEPSSIDKET